MIVQRYLVREDVHFSHAARKPLLTFRHRKQRLALAHANSHWTDEGMMDVLFSDESTTEIHPNCVGKECYRTSHQNSFLGSLCKL